MPTPRQFNLLVVKDDGSRVVRLTVPRWVVVGAVGGTLLVIGSLTAIYSDYLLLRQQRATFAALTARLASQQTLLDASQARMKAIRKEIDSWRDLHGRIWEPFGPEAGPAKRGTGIGGGTAGRLLTDSGRGARSDRDGIREEMDQLVGIVKDEGESLRSLERFLGKASKVLASLPSRWPLRGPVNSDFGKRLSPWAPNSEFHSGIDIGAPIGTPVRAPAPGTVVFAGPHSEYGIIVVIDHGNDTKSLYGHLSKLQVAVDHQVQRGEVIAMTGNTGRSSGPHLHYEIQVKGQPVNPHSYIWEDPVTAVAQGRPAR